MRKESRTRIFLALLLTAAAAPAAGQSQTAGNAARDSSSLRGEVIEAGTGEPLPDVLMSLRSLALTPSHVDSTDVRSTLTDRSGRYAFDGLAAGEYELMVTRVGYRTARVRLEIRRAGRARVAIGLELEPIALEPVRVVGEGRTPYGRDQATADADDGEVAAAEQRQRLYLASDAWSLTHGELLRAVTLAESDIFRALHRLPGVSTRDDWTAELWLRGSAWDHTRVYFDGLPLFNPVHGGGIFSGVNSDAVGAVYLHPGVRPARLGEGGSAVEITSRPAGGTGDLRGVAELSLASARVAVDRRTADGQGGWMLALRRTYLDWLSSGLGQLLDVDDAAVPYRFTDVTARLDQRLAGKKSLEASVLWEADLLDGDIPDLVHGSRMAWGNLGAQATLQSHHGRLKARHTVGFTGYKVEVDSVVSSISDFDADAIGEIRHELHYLVAKGELSPVTVGGRWRAGYEVVHQSLRTTAVR